MSPSTVAALPKTPVPENESARLAALLELDILDTLPEDAIDRITRLAARILGVPIALVSLVDSDRQWFKSRVGLDAPETHRDLAFCAHAIMRDDVMVVSDATKDWRFANNPLVTGPPDIRFYAGAPLILRDGVRLGTLCAIDTKPRDLSHEDEVALRDLAAVVVDELQLRRSLRDQDDTTRLLRKKQLELENANDALDQFAHLAAHDLRAPLKKVINLLDIALLDDDLDRRGHVELARASLEGLEKVVAGYRALTRLQRTVDEVHLVSHLVERAQALTGDATSIDVRSDVPLRGDPILLTQLFTNLIENAEQHGAGGPLTVEADSDDQRTRIVVSNHVQSALSFDQTIFAPFRRLDANSAGTGLGLAIVERIARVHGGSVLARCVDRVFAIEVCISHCDSGRATEDEQPR